MAQKMRQIRKQKYFHHAKLFQQTRQPFRQPVTWSDTKTQNTQGPAYDEFGYNELPATTNK